MDAIRRTLEGGGVEFIEQKWHRAGDTTEGPNRVSLEDCIAKVAAEIKASRPLPDEILSQDAHPRITGGPANAPGMSELTAVLRQDTEFGSLIGQTQLGIDRIYGTVVSAPLLATSIACRCLALGSATAALAELRDLMHNNIGTAQLHAELTGVTVDLQGELSGGLVIIPSRETLRPHWMNNLPDRSGKLLSRNCDVVLPTSTLVLDVSFTPVFVKDWQREDRFPAKEIRRMTDVVGCLSVVTEHEIAISRMWFSDATPSAPMNVSAVQFTDPRWMQGAVEHPVHLSIADAADLLAAYEKLACEKTKASIDIAIQRLLRSRRQWDLTDQAIDLGVCLEVLLGHSDTGERLTAVTNQLSGRAAWLDGQSLEDRKTTAALVRTLYDLRSQAVHTGQIVSRRKGPKPDQIIEQGIALANRLIQNVVRRGRFPQWLDLVLGSEI